MGYKSDVRMIASKKGFKMLEGIISKYLEDKKSDDNLFKYTDVKKSCDDFVYLGWNNIKWYEFDDSFVGIQALYNGLEELKKKGYSYHLSILGSDYDDFESHDFEGKKEKFYLPYPRLIREFDDKYIDQEISYSKDKNCSKELNL
jgi:hypothetical protein